MFRASIVKVTDGSCGRQVVGACHGSNIRTSLWTPAVRDAVKLKKESYRTLFSCGTMEAVNRYRQAKRNAASEVTECPLRLERKVMITPEVQTIKFSTDCADIWPGMTCSVAGWGCTFISGRGSNVLREVDVTIQNICRSEQCYNLSRGTVFCAMGPGIKAACEGDSGGPLVTRNKLNETLAVGIVSFGNTEYCVTPKPENVYTNICMFWPWIQSKFNGIAAE
ncbi:granzyme H-like [Polypterus senegalus]|uniref:granzyme H-like n=1 Tax=Polypterus senegalus TaxID=55291 RepID=UPI001966ABBA|nr:granzyme H-like [Polypterus senegalus]